jgi:hypothetical protein
MRGWRVAIGVLGLGVSCLPAASGLATAVVSAQSLARPASRLQHATVTASSPTPAVRPGDRVVLWVDVNPKPRVHLYATGAKDFTAAALVMTPVEDVQVARPQFPPGEPFLTLGATAPVPVYRKPFRISQTITIAPSRAAGPLIVSAAFNYQACDDVVCYPATSAPVIWNLVVR